MVVTHFRSRLRADVPPESHETAQRLVQLASGGRGLIEYKAFQAEDGERFTLVVFDSAQNQRAWLEDPEHRAAQQRGRERFYESYSIQTFQAPSATRTWCRER